MATKGTAMATTASELVLHMRAERKARIGVALEVLRLKNVERWTWRQIGEAVGTTGQAAWQRWSEFVSVSGGAPRSSAGASDRWLSLAQASHLTGLSSSEVEQACKTRKGTDGTKYVRQSEVIKSALGAA